MEFFLTGVAETAEQATETARELMTMFERDRRTIQAFGRSAPSVLRVHEHLQKRPIVSIQGAAKELVMSIPTVNKALDLMTGERIVRETTGRRRNRLFVYSDYLALLDRGTEPLAR